MDWNNDGRLDILTGDYDGYVRVYLNSASGLQNFSYVRVGSSNFKTNYYSKPEVCDWNNDGRSDLVVGDGLNGTLHLLLNTGTLSAPAFATSTLIKAGASNIDVGSRASPVVVDWNRDGKKDLIVGETYGALYFFENTGTDAAPAFSSSTTLSAAGSPINVGYYARPEVADWNNDGVQDLIVGMSGDDPYHAALYYRASLPIPVVPTNVAASDNTFTDKVRVTWNASSGATSYEIWRNTSTTTGAATRLTANATGTSYDDTSAVPGTTYYYWVRARNSGGLSAYSSPNAGARALTAPAAPSGVTASDGTFADKVAVAWTASPWAASYDVWRSDTSNPASATKIGADLAGTAFNDTTAIPTTNYWYWVMAKNSAGSSLFSASDQGYRRAAPINIDLSNNALAEGQPAGTLIGTFTTSDADVGDTFTYSLVSGIGDTDNALFAISNDGLITAAILDFETKDFYGIRVRTTDAGGAHCEEMFNVFLTDVLDAPIAPTGVTASDNLADKVRVTWPATPGATAYDVWRNTANDPNTATKVAADLVVATFDDATVTAGATYYYWIAARNAVGDSPLSGPDAGTRLVPLVRILDDGEANVTFTGAGWKTAAKQGYKADLRYAYPNPKAPNKACWTFKSITPGIYRVYVTWVTASNRATNAKFGVYQGSANRGSVLVNQRVAPTGTLIGGMRFKDLGRTFSITGSSFSLWLMDAQANGYIIADAVRIERVGNLPTMLVAASQVAAPAAPAPVVKASIRTARLFSTEPFVL